MQGNQLKRSHKTDFTTSTVTRERSFVKPNKDPQKRRSQAVFANLNKGKPAMEIYRPPNNSKSSHNIAAYHQQQQLYENSIPLQQSKSSGNILHHHHHMPGVISILPSPMALPLLQPNFSHLPRVNFQMANEVLQNHPMYASNIGWNGNNRRNDRNERACLKRSKSLGAADSLNIATKLKGFSKDETDLGQFSTEDQDHLNTAVEDPNSLPSRTLMDLVKIILERVVEGIRYSEPGAKLCISIIEKEKNQTFIESLINTCQQWFQERDKILRGVKSGDGTRFTAFMWFLTEMCSQLKRYKHQCQYENAQADLVLLSILAKCCQACVGLPIKCLPETECLFFVLTSIGRDLESELPQQLEQLLASVRDAFLASVGSPAVRKTLLQLIELHASNWQLPGSSVLYYYPRVK